MGVQNGKVDGPDGLPDIECIGNNGIGQPDPEGIGCHALHGADILLGNIGYGGGGGGENDERHLFCNESDSRCTRKRRGTGAPSVEGGLHPGKPPQGPIIKKQQDKWKGDDHRLRHQAQNE